MLDLAISIEADKAGTALVETNNGLKLKAPGWPQDCDFQLVAFNPSRKTCEVVAADELARDIGDALVTLRATGAFKDQFPAWYRRLAHYAEDASRPPSS